jgi:hypothetical protein
MCETEVLSLCRHSGCPRGRGAAGPRVAAQPMGARLRLGDVRVPELDHQQLPGSARPGEKVKSVLKVRFTGLTQNSQVDTAAV